MKKPLIYVVIAVIVLVTSIFTAYTYFHIFKVQAEDAIAPYSDTFTATLSGNEQVPSINATSSGAAQFNIFKNGIGIGYIINIQNGTHITEADLHCSLSGTNGPAIVQLFISTTTPVNSNGLLVSGTLVDSNILPVAATCNPNITNLSQLIQAMREGSIYVNVHTVQNPAGEIRGQIMKNDHVTAFPQGMYTVPSTMTQSQASATTTSSNSTTTIISTISGTQFQSSLSSNPASNLAETSDSSGAHILLSSYYLLPRDSVTITGNLFGVNENVVISAFGMNQTVMTNSAGYFVSRPMAIPINDIHTTQTITAQGLSSGRVRVAHLVVGSYYPFVAADSYFILPGNSVRFSGQYFAPNESVSVQSDEGTFGTIQADANGQFTTGSYVVPFNSGRKVYTFTGLQSNLSYSVAVSIATRNPWLILSNYYEGAGTSLTIRGHGFGSQEKVDVIFNESFVGSAVTDDSGHFSLIMTVPTSGAGTKIVKAIGEATHASATENFSQSF